MRSLTVKDVAAQLSVSEAWVRRAMAAGELQGHRAGRAVRVYAASVEAYQARNALGAAVPPAGETTRRKRSAPAPAHEGFREAQSTLKLLVWT